MQNKSHNSYREEGVVIYPHSIFSTDTLTAALQCVDDVLAGHYDTGINPWGSAGVGDRHKLQRLGQIHMTNKNLYRLITSKVIGELAADVTGANKVKLWGSQLYNKPAGSNNGGHVGLHRDSQHMPYFTDGVLTAWLPLMDISIDSGPLTYIKGSHKWNVHSEYACADEQDLDTQRKSLKREYEKHFWSEIDVVIPAGAISFHHKDVLHGSASNKTRTDRYAIAIGLLTEQAKFDPNQQDFGFASIIENSRYCPVIFER